MTLMASRGPARATGAAAPPRRKLRVTVSFVIALLLVASGVVRLAGGTGAAIAREVADFGTDRPAVMAALAPAACVSGPQIESLLEDLEAERAALAVRRGTLDMRESDLAASLSLVGTQLAALEEAEAELRSLISMAETASESDIAQLTTVYENMKPKEAAAVFERMAPQFAAGFLGRMRPEAAARILAGLEPETAYGVSAILAGRNAAVPTE
jgi:flagellar motility protein MotE (MotC chaperone)